NKIKEINGLENLNNLIMIDLSHNEIINAKPLENLPLLKFKELKGNPGIKPTKTQPPSTRVVQNPYQTAQLKRSITRRDLGYRKVVENELLEKRMKFVQFHNMRFRIVKLKYGGLKLSIVDRGVTNISDIIGLNLLTDLEELDLSQNRIKEISGLETLTNLRVLRLSSNYISEIKGLENLESLEELYLDGNFINELKGLENLKYLGMLDLSSNNLTESEDLLLKNLENLSFLHKVELKGNPRGNLDQKELLDMRETEVAPRKFWDHPPPEGRDQTPYKIGQHEDQIASRQLKYRKVVENELLEKGRKFVQYRNMRFRIVKLKYGGLKLNIVDRGIINISNIIGLNLLNDLEELDLSQNRIEEINGLESLTNLRVLKLSNNYISDIKGLENLESLEELYLDGNFINELKGLDNLKYLGILDLSNNELSEPEDVLLKNLESLTYLREKKLEGNPRGKRRIVESADRWEINLSPGSSRGKREIVESIDMRETELPLRKLKGSPQVRNIRICLAIIGILLFIGGIAIAISSVLSVFSGADAITQGSSIPLALTMIIIGLLFAVIGTKGQCLGICECGC
ncbi:MAG: leucine-rich repeat domain-containing protein, partial [Promethearchaeota archaeon]